jgi:hypothetical protein
VAFAIKRALDRVKLLLVHKLRHAHVKVLGCFVIAVPHVARAFISEPRLLVLRTRQFARVPRRMVVKIGRLVRVRKILRMLQLVVLINAGHEVLQIFSALVFTWAVNCVRPVAALEVWRAKS